MTLKPTLTFFFTLTVMLTFPILSFAVDISRKSQDTEIIEIESVRPEGKVTFTKTTLTAPSGRVYSIQPLPNDPELLANFMALSTTQKNQFYKRRNSILGSLIEKMDKDNSIQSLGRYVSFKGKVVKFFTKKTNDNEVDHKSEQFNAIKNIGQQQVQELIMKMEEVFWKSSALFAEVNTKGKSIGINGAIGLGLAEKGTMLNLSLGVGYFENAAIGKKYIELFFIQENFVRALTYSAPVYLGLRVAWLNWRNELNQEVSGVSRGEAQNMPAFLPYVFRSNNEFSMVTGAGMDALDLIVPMQSFAQTYRTSWTRRHFRLYYGKIKATNRCLNHFI